MKTAIGILLCFGAFLRLEAETLYVRAGASGANNGTSVTDAWRDSTNVVFGSGVGQLGAGDTLVYCGSTNVYSRLLITGSGATNNILTITRARDTNSVHSSSTGWSSAYDSTVIIERVSCNSPGAGNFLTIDGVIPGGISITNTSTGCQNGTNNIDTYNIDFNASGASYVTLLNLDIGGRGADDQNFGCSPFNTAAEGRCVSFNNNTGTQAHELTIKYCDLHNMATLGIVYGYTDVVIEHNKLRNNLVQNTAANHPNCWVAVGVTNLYYGYNEHTNLQAEAGWMLTPDSPSNPAVVNLYIYGNVWHHFKGTVARVLESQYRTNGPVYAYNNTVSSNTAFINLANGGSWHSTCASSNNATEGGQAFAFNSNHGGNKTNLTHSAFIDAANGNFRIASNSVLVNAGVALLPPFNIDADGNTRGEDGAFDVGAYEFTTSDTPPPRFVRVRKQ